MWTSLWGSTLPGVMGEQEQRHRFSYALRMALEYRKASQRQLAIALDIDPRKVAKWVAGEGLPNLYESQALAGVLQVDEDLFRNPPEPPPPPPPYPLERYLLETGDSGAAEAYRRASTPQVPPARGTPAHSRARSPREAEAGHG